MTMSISPGNLMTARIIAWAAFTFFITAMM